MAGPAWHISRINFSSFRKPSLAPLLISCPGQLPQDHSPTAGQVSPDLTNSLPSGKVLFPSYLHPILLRGTSTFPLNPYPSLRSQLLALQAFTLRVFSPDSSPRPAVGGRARRSHPEQLVQGLHPTDPSSSDRCCPSQWGVGGRVRTPLGAFSQLPVTPDPGLPGSPHLPPLSDRGHSQFFRSPRLPAHREAPGAPSLSGPRAARSGSPPLAHPRRSVSSGSRAHAGLPSLTPGPSRWFAQGTSRPGPPGSRTNLPSRRRSPSAGNQPFSRRAAPGPDTTRPAAPVRGLRLRNAKLEFPARHRLRTSGPPRPHSPAAGPAQLQRLTLYLPPPPVATKRHHLPHDNRPAPYHTSNLSIGWRGGGSLLRLVGNSCPSSRLYRPFSWTGSSPPPGPGPA